MNEYKPKSRRPIAGLFRKTADGVVKFCVKHDIHPDIISYSSIMASIVAALCFWKSGNYPLLLFIAPFFCYMRLWLNMLDGMVALSSGKASLHGEVINEFPDRISDILIFAGVAHSGWSIMSLGYLGAVFAVLTAYTGIFGQAVGVQREFSGVMSKPWRMVLL
ncbi:MAG: CDP-alcohol phosphatidyltransferase family protein, partial [Candidatus Aureabacteria bacterium]|nr:CDP-alcohol phosphatidyltransferase family protein [Candidatus Auribacterota bacterium]